MKNIVYQNNMGIVETGRNGGLVMMVVVPLVEYNVSTWLNPHNVSRECKGELKERLLPHLRSPALKFILLTWHFTITIGKHLDQPVLRERPGVGPSVTSIFSSCDENDGGLFYQSMDLCHRRVSISQFDWSAEFKY